MKNIFNIILCLLLLAACDDQIYPDLADAPPIIVVDAWINNKPEPQTIKLSMTQPYFDNSEDSGITNASVFIIDNEGNRFDFLDNGDGNYTWTPPVNESFGKVDNTYDLTVISEGITIQSSSKMNRVPKVDSITFRWEEESLGFPESYFGEFWSRDLEGTGDTYWIKAYKNDQLLNKPSELNLAYDAGFSAGGEIDGLIFISPIRDAVNPFDESTDGQEMLSPYSDGDSLHVEVYSITNEAHTFLTELRIQTDRPGGFAELFASPLSNVDTNIENTTSNEIALGFFCVSAVEGNGKRLDIKNVPKVP
jgi:hypothetical protein